MVAADPAVFSLKEAAVLAKVPEGKVRREIENRVIDPEVVWVGRAPRRFFRKPEIYYLGFLGLLRDDIEFSRSLRRRLYQSIKRHGRRAPQPELNPVVRLDYDRLVRTLEPRIKLYDSGRKRIANQDDILGGEPVFKGTRLAVRHIGGMRLRAEPVERILEDYPYLTEADIEFAALYTEANPPFGRPKSSSDAA